MPDILVFESIRKQFGANRAVDDVSLSIGRGETFSLLGPSGCGKTTLLRMAAGFEAPDSGRILLDGKDITSLPPEKRPVNTVFQSYALFPHLSVRENIGFGLRIAGHGRDHIKGEVEFMLNLTQLTEHADKRPSQLSGGQRQRVAIARALVNKPRVLLLDEPLAALDLKLRQHMLGELRRLHDEVGITFIYVTHDQDEALSLSDRIGVMHRGRLAQVGTPEELYERPQNRFVAVEGVGEFESVARESYAMGSLLDLSLRPERISLALEKPSSLEGGTAFPATVEESTYLGKGAHVKATSSAGHAITIEVTYDEVGGALSRLSKGTPVWLFVRSTDTLLLPKE